jgi:hypothetical protein
MFEYFSLPRPRGPALLKFFKPNDDGNEPAPLMLIAVAVVPLLLVLGWFLWA